MCGNRGLLARNAVAAGEAKGRAGRIRANRQSACDADGMHVDMTGLVTSRWIVGACATGRWHFLQQCHLHARMRSLLPVPLNFRRQYVNRFQIHSTSLPTTRNPALHDAFVDLSWSHSVSKVCKQALRMVVWFGCVSGHVSIAVRPSGCGKRQKASFVSSLQILCTPCRARVLQSSTRIHTHGFISRP